MNCTNWNLVGTFAALSFCGLLAAMLLRRPLKAAGASFMAMPNMGFFNVSADSPAASAGISW